MATPQTTRTLQRLIERLEEFLDDYKIDLEADEAAAIDDAITVIDKVKTDLENQDDESDPDDEFGNSDT